MPKTIDEWAAENGYEKNQWGYYPNIVEAAYKDYIKNFKTGDLPKSPDVTNPLPNPENWANEHKMDDQSQYEHDVQVANPLSALARQESKDKENLKEAADQAGIETVEDKSALSGVENLFDNGRVAYADTVTNATPNATGSTESGTANEKGTGSGSGSGNPPTTNAPTNHYTPMSIMQAYYAGCFGDPNSAEAKASRNYFLGDVVSSFVRNLGRDVGNVGAQFSGGTIDNNRDTSKWDTRNEEMLKQGISSEAATVQGSDKDIERQLQENVINSGKLSNEQKQHVLSATRTISELKNKTKDPSLKALYSGLEASMASGSIDGIGLGALIVGGKLSDIESKWNEWKKNNPKASTFDKFLHFLLKQTPLGSISK